MMNYGVVHWLVDKRSSDMRNNRLVNIMQQLKVKVRSLKRRTFFVQH